MANDVPVVREDGLASVGKNAAEETNRRIRVGLAIRDVPPCELAAIILRRELHVRTHAEGLRHKAGEHRRAEHDRIFVFSGQVVRVEVITHTTSGTVRSAGVRANPNPRARTSVVVVAGEERINQVEVVPVGPLHTQGGKQLINPIAPAEVLSDISVRAD